MNRHERRAMAADAKRVPIGHGTFGDRAAADAAVRTWARAAWACGIERPVAVVDESRPGRVRALVASRDLERRMIREHEPELAPDVLPELAHDDPPRSLRVLVFRGDAWSSSILDEAAIAAGRV